MPPTHKTVAQVGSMIPDGTDVALSPEEAAAVQAEWDANPPLTQAQVLARVRAKAVAVMQAQEQAEATIRRAILLTQLDDRNELASVIASLLVAINNATSLADLKARAALITRPGQYTATQMRNAIENKALAGDADV